MLGGADNPNGELPSYITGADTIIYALVNQKKSPVGIGGYVRRNNFAGVLVCIT